MTTRAAWMLASLALLAVAALALGGCTITEVDQDGARTRSISFGPAVLPAVDGAYSARVRGVGVALTFHSGVVGYFDVRSTYIARDCFALFVVPDATEAARIASLLPPGTCSTTGD